MSEGPRGERLSAAYRSASTEGARAFYDDWAPRYDRENIGKGFRLPFFGAALLARHLGAAPSGPLLDAACGTGLVGESLALLGYEGLTGCDVSPEMLKAAAETRAYRTLDTADLTALPYVDGTFAAFACVGAFGPGHAPPSALAELARVTRPGGVGVFTLREDTYVGQGFPAAMDALATGGVWRELQRTPAFRAYLLDEPDLYARAVAVEILR